MPAPSHPDTQTLLPLLPFQNPPDLLRARNLLDLRIRTGSPRPWGLGAWAQLVLYVQAPFYVSIETCRLPKSVAGYFTWDWYKAYRRRVRESAIYDKLKKGPVFQEAIEDIIPRKPLVEKIRQLI